uniref:Uncharacterized protein n=1 Tax=Rhizophora mucronata TaxID=61149 RepID=A0A2P2QK34_RHIMU
MFLFESRQLAT